MPSVTSSNNSKALLCSGAIDANSRTPRSRTFMQKGEDQDVSWRGLAETGTNGYIVLGYSGDQDRLLFEHRLPDQALPGREFMGNGLAAYVGMTGAQFIDPVFSGPVKSPDLCSQKRCEVPG